MTKKQLPRNKGKKELFHRLLQERSQDFESEEQYFCYCCTELGMCMDEVFALDIHNHLWKPSARERPITDISYERGAELLDTLLHNLQDSHTEDDTFYSRIKETLCLTNNEMAELLPEIHENTAIPQTPTL